MPDLPPKSDIHYSIMREEPRATFVFPEQFTEKSYSYEDVFINELLIEQQPYELNKYSPTPLDPFHLKLHNSDYFTAASVYMEGRLTESANAIGLSDHARQTIASEIEYEHLHRSLKNNEAMKRTRLEFDPGDQIDPLTARLILRARAARADITETAYVLAGFPEAEAIEIIKYTAPLEVNTSSASSKKVVDPARKLGIPFAHAQFMYSLHMAGRTNPHLIIDTSNHRPARPRNSHDSVRDNIFITKGKEADIYVNGVHMELMSRYSYYVPDVAEPALERVQSTNTIINGHEIKMYDISMTKYLRIARNDNQ